MNQTTKIRSGVGLVLGMTVLAAVVVFGLFSGSDQSDATITRIDQASTHPVSVLEPVQAVDLENLNEEATFRLGITTDRFASYGDDPHVTVDSLAHVTTADGRSVYIYGIDKSVCFFEERGAGTCGDDEDMRNEGLTVESPDGCDGWQILGLAPDGVVSVTTTNRDGNDTNSWPVSSNVYVANVGHQDVDLEGYDASRNKVFDFPVDISWMDEGMSDCTQGA